MDESIQTNLAADSTQSNAALDNPSNCAKSPFVRPKTEYIEFFDKLTRAAYNVAQVWSFLVFRCQRNKPGDSSARLEVIREGGRWGERAYWYLHTPEDIARECGKSVYKVESALKILKRLGMIEARAGRHPMNGEVARYRGLTVTHIRLAVCARGNGLDAWPTIEQMGQMRIIPGMAEAVPISSAEAVLLLPDTKEVLDTLEGNTQSGISGTAEPEAMHQGKTNKASGDIQNPKVKPRASQAVEDVLLSRKLEWLTVATNSDNPSGCLAPELTEADRDAAQRIEYRLHEASIDPLTFLNWWTCARFQQFAFSLADEADFSPLWISKLAHLAAMVDHYQEHQAALAAKFAPAYPGTLTAAAKNFKASQDQAKKFAAMLAA